MMSEEPIHQMILDSYLTELDMDEQGALNDDRRAFRKGV